MFSRRLSPVIGIVRVVQLLKSKYMCRIFKCLKFQLYTIAALKHFKNKLILAYHNWNVNGYKLSSYYNSNAVLIGCVWNYLRLQMCVRHRKINMNYNILVRWQTSHRIQNGRRKLRGVDTDVRRRNISLLSQFHSWQICWFKCYTRLVCHHIM
jgi:hypothetical protein